MSLKFSASGRLGKFAYEAEFDAGEEIVVLFGHSGAGKSVTLQFVAGLLRPDKGHIEVDGRTVFDGDRQIDVRPQERNVGYVVQQLALFPHLTVAQNVGFGMPRAVDRRRRTAELLALLGLEGFEDRRPASLSGGQQQRVALARALARDSQLLLLDEPFSALDDSLRAGLRKELLRLRSELGLTVLFVTHDLREAHLLADRLAVFDDGKVLQFGPRNDVFRRPANRRVGELTGVANIWPGKVVAIDGDSVLVDVAGVRFRGTPGPGRSLSPGQPVDCLVRAERVNLRRGDDADVVPNAVMAQLVEEYAYGNSHVLHLEPEGHGPRIEAEIATRPYEVMGVAARKRWLVEIPHEDIHVVPAAAGP